MGRTRVSPDGHEIADLVADLPSGRFVLGLAGAPGAGKSTLAAALATAYGCPVVPMDGFHRPNAELVTMGRLDAKGAHDTFDAERYAELLGRLHAGGTVLAPSFDHSQPDPLPDTIEVPAAAGLVVTEGNYLLLDQPEWVAVRRQLDAVWHLETEETQRVERLVSRHVDAGRSQQAALAWVSHVDQANARLVESAAGSADQVLDLVDWSGEVRVEAASLPADRVETTHEVDEDEPDERGLHAWHHEYDLIWMTVDSTRILARRYSDTPHRASLMAVEEGGVRRFIQTSDLTTPLVAAAVAHLRSIGVEDVERLGGGHGYDPVEL